MATKFFKLPLLSLAFLASCSQPSNPSEGTATNIVGGQVSSETFQKDNGIVAVTILKANGGDLCGGTLITRRVVLTAAHCVDTTMPIRGIYVTFASRLDQVDGESTTHELVRQAVKSEIHADFPNFTADQGHNDIALLLLDREAPEDFKTVRLAQSHVYTRSGQRLIQAGFGRTRVEAGPDPDWRILHDVSGIQVLGTTPDLKDLILEEDQKGSCGGDSGGPAFARSSRGGVVQVGVNSRATVAGNCLVRGLYTNVASYYRWIRRTTRALEASDTRN